MCFRVKAGLNKLLRNPVRIARPAAVHAKYRSAQLSHSDRPHTELSGGHTGESDRQSTEIGGTRDGNRLRRFYTDFRKIRIQGVGDHIR